MVLSGSFENGNGTILGRSDSEAEESEEEYTEHEQEHATNGALARNEGATTHTQEEAAFWIPQATPDGRLFYFNTLTGESTMELPLEAPTSTNETGPRDRTNIFIPDQTRPPAEFLAGGYERDDDTDYASASEAEDASTAHDSKASSVSDTFARALELVIYVTPTNAANLSASTKTVVFVRRRVTCDVHGFSQRSISENPLSHKSHNRSKQCVAFGHATGNSTRRYHHELIR